MDKILKKGLLIIIFGLLLMPLFQQNFFFVDCGDLHGYYTYAPGAQPTVKKWFDGTFAQAEASYLNDHMGLRPWLIRLNSQIDYSLFQKIDYGGAVSGRDHYLFYREYINAYYGMDYAGYDSLRARLVKLKAIQDTLSRLGKSLIMVYAPCKAWYCSEYIPAGLKPAFPGPNNYKTSVRIGDSLGINQVDLNSWFLSLKSNTRELLFAKQAIHWTNYGSIFGGDSLGRYIERLRGVHMFHPRWDSVIHTKIPRDPDNDMADLSNLIFPIVTETFCYPGLYYVRDSTATRPVAVFIGDSYTVNLFRTGLMQHEYNNWQFWFSFKWVVNDSNYNYDRNNFPLDTSKYMDEVNKAECIILFYTPHNCGWLGNGFIEKTYDHYYLKK